MAKFYGIIGYVKEMDESTPGVWDEDIIERSYYGELEPNFRRLQYSGQVNDNVNINNVISIVADPYANQNFHAMRYVEFMGTKWRITNVEVRYPRLILTIGGVWNGNTPIDIPPETY